MPLKFGIAGACAMIALTASAFAQVRHNDRAPADTYYDQSCDNRGPAAMGCARDAFATADRDLNVVYQRLMRNAAASDAQERVQRFPGWYSQAIALRNAERAWMAMRDADCRFVTQPDIGRRRSELTYTMCLVERTEVRTAQLRDMSEQMYPRRRA